jgi:Uma2 family endonuclease
MTTAIAAKRRRIKKPKIEHYADAGTCVNLPAATMSLDDFRAWVLSDEFPDQIRVTYVDKEIYLDMSKEELESHAAVKLEISWVLSGLFRHTRKGKFYLDGVLVTNTAASVSNNPDAVFVSRESLELGRVRLVPKDSKQETYFEIVGTPDWVLEIVSKSSVRKDTKQLRQAYHKAGIPEYWIVDARGEELSFQILHWRKNGYISAPSKAGWQRSRIFDRWFRLSRTRDDMGYWEYDLEMRSV